MRLIDGALGQNIPVRLFIEQHDEGVNRLQEWIRLPSIAAEDRGLPAGPEYMVGVLKDAVFQTASIIETDGKPGVFATLDAGAAHTVGRGAVNQK